MTDIGVVYLFRFAEAIEPAKRFVESSRRHPAGSVHNLFVILKGFPDEAAMERGRAIFEGIPIAIVELPDRGRDIGSYLAASRQLTCETLLFLNTFSQIEADHWLARFESAISRPGVGLVGATGSWQSPFSTKYPFGFEMNEPWRLPSFVKSFTAFPAFPNPHVRTNAFMIRRDVLLSLRIPEIRDKDTAYRVESGRDSITRQVQRRHLEVVVVDRHGNAFPPENWVESRAFWTADQENRLVSDNQTEDYRAGEPLRRIYLESVAWCDPRDRFGPPLRIGKSTADLALCKANGLEAVDDHEWKAVANDAWLEEESPLLRRGPMVVEAVISVRSGAAANVALVGRGRAGPRSFSFGPIRGTQAIRRACRFPRSGAFASLSIRGEPGARIAVRRVTLRRMHLRERIAQLAGPFYFRANAREDLL